MYWTHLFFFISLILFWDFICTTILYFVFFLLPFDTHSWLPWINHHCGGCQIVSSIFIILPLVIRGHSIHIRRSLFFPTYFLLVFKIIVIHLLFFIFILTLAQIWPVGAYCSQLLLFWHTNSILSFWHKIHVHLMISMSHFWNQLFNTISVLMQDCI